MKTVNMIIALALLLAASLSCKFLKDKVPTAASDAPKIDFITPSRGVDVKVELDKKQTSSGNIGKAGGSVSLAAADGSKFVLDIPVNAVDADTRITMTAVTSLEGPSQNSTTPTAVQLEPSGLTFKQVATLTITPSKEIPINEQIVFGYEGDGKDYHLAPVDPKSREIRVKLLGFSGVGVASASDAAWAAHLMNDASTASTRLIQKLGAITQTERREVLLGRKEGASTGEIFRPFIDAFIDQVVFKELAAAELDCKHAQQALDDLIFIERLTELVGLGDDQKTGINDFNGKKDRLLAQGKKCKKTSYRAEGSTGGASFKGDICDLNKPFTIHVDAITGKWDMNFTPESESAGTMDGSYSGNGCTLTGEGPYTTSIGENDSGTLTFTYNSTAACPGVPSRTTSKTTTLQLKPASDLRCE